MIRLLLVAIVATCIIHVNSKAINKKEQDTNIYAFETSNEASKPLPAKKSARKAVKKVTHVNKMSKRQVTDDIDEEQNDVDTRRRMPNYFNKYIKQIVEFFKEKGEPMYRAADKKYNINPQLIKLRSDPDKETLKFEINPKIIGQVISDVMQTDIFKKNFEGIVRRAANVLQAMQGHNQRT